MTEQKNHGLIDLQTTPDLADVICNHQPTNEEAVKFARGWLDKLGYDADLATSEEREDTPEYDLYWFLISTYGTTKALEAVLRISPYRSIFNK